MAKPSSRQGLIDYCLRRLGAPVLEINIDDEQIDDLVDDALQYFNERHFDGVEKMYLKYQVTQEDIDRGKASAKDPKGPGITTTTGTSSINGVSKSFNFYESSNYIQIPDSVIGVEKLFKFNASTISSGMFSIKYQLFLNDLYYFNSIQLLPLKSSNPKLSILSRIFGFILADGSINIYERRGVKFIACSLDNHPAISQSRLTSSCVILFPPLLFYIHMLEHPCHLVPL